MAMPWQHADPAPGVTPPRRRAPLQRRGHWNIGVSGLTVEEMLRAGDTGDVTWLHTRPDTFAADPFGVAIDGATHVFFEEYSYRTDRGVIAHTTYSAGGGFGDIQVIL